MDVFAEEDLWGGEAPHLQDGFALADGLELIVERNLLSSSLVDLLLVAKVDAASELQLVGRVGVFFIDRCAVVKVLGDLTD